MFISEPYLVPRLGHSLYWVIHGDYHDLPQQYFDFQLKLLLAKKTEFVQIYDQVKDVVIDDRLDTKNPHCFLTEEEKEDFFEMKPKRERPMATQGSTIMRRIRYKHVESAIDHAFAMIEADCWGVYTRDEQGVPVKIYFDARNGNKEGRRELRDRDTLQQEMKQAFESKLTFCVVMGEDNFVDCYYYPDGEIVEIQYK